MYYATLNYLSVNITAESITDKIRELVKYSFTLMVLFPSFIDRLVSLS